MSNARVTQMRVYRTFCMQSRKTLNAGVEPDFASVVRMTVLRTSCSQKRSRKAMIGMRNPETRGATD